MAASPQGEVIRGSSSRFPALPWLAGLGVCSIVTAYGVNFVATRGGETFGLLVLGLAELGGLYILWRAVLATRRWHRYRKLELRLSPCPAEVGGLVAGALVVPIAFDAARPFDIVLSCVEHGVQSDGSLKRHRYQAERHRDSSAARVAAAPGGTQLSFRFTIPGDALPSEDVVPLPLGDRAGFRQEASVRWTLRFSGPANGIDLDETFEIPLRKAPPTVRG